ncbi:MAG: hypothetical protein ACREP8_03015 [Candidatus Binatia bacterium]
MPSLNSPNQASRAEIGFDAFPCGPCAVEADRHLRTLDGVIEILFDEAVRRAAVVFDPRRVGIPLILSTLQPFCLNPKVISVISPMRGILHGENGGAR